jgi:predicted ribosomally synthesized peptide with SipW-like signal peptide
MAPRILRFKKTIIVASIAALSLVGAGVAFAYWTSTGTGDGEAQTGTQQATFTVNVDAAIGDPLVPGGPSQTVSFTVTNSGPETLLLGDVTLSMSTVVAGVVTPWAPAGCVGIDNYTAVITTPIASVNIDGGDTSLAGTATITMLATAFDQSGCQGLDVPLHFVASSIQPPV